ncbi:hypothetical protein GQ457_12G032260 [Hibiscus cannabinus]
MIHSSRYLNNPVMIELLTLTVENMVLAKQEGLLKKFKLTPSKMQLSDSRGVIQNYDTPEEVLEEFFHLRLDFYVKRRRHVLDTLELELLKMDNKVRLIVDVVKEEDAAEITVAWDIDGEKPVQNSEEEEGQHGNNGAENGAGKKARRQASKNPRKPNKKDQAVSKVSNISPSSMQTEIVPATVVKPKGRGGPKKAKDDRDDDDSYDIPDLREHLAKHNTDSSPDHSISAEISKSIG